MMAQTTITIAFVMCIWTSFAFALPPFTTANNENKENNILYISIPPDVSRDTIHFAKDRLKDRLHELTKELLYTKTLGNNRLDEEESIDSIVIFTDNVGQPILPDLENSSRILNINRLAELTTTNGNEITFTFNSSSYPWSDADLTVLTTTLNDCYNQTKRIYGNPAFNITVNIRQDPTISFAGLYYPSMNEMVIKNLSTPDPICHELIHAFHDDNIITLSSYEEGMTRATEVEVFDHLPAYNYFNRNHSYTYDVYYEALNKQKIGSKYGNFFLGAPLLLRYQLSGYAWAKCLLENPKFLANFNRKLYAMTLLDSTTLSTESELINIASKVQPKVENKAFKTWYRHQGVLNTNPPNGYFLYQRINQFTVDYFYRDQYGVETLQPGATVDWVVYDHNDVPVDSGTGVTSVNGLINFIPTLPTDYTGRINVVVRTNSPNGLVRDSTLGYAGNTEGCFGIVKNANTGTITIAALDANIAPVKVNLVNGSFSAPSLANIRGRFHIVFVNSAGETFSKQFNKDASNYFVSIKP
jgi:hypothetical protein